MSANHYKSILPNLPKPVPHEELKKIQQAGWVTDYAWISGMAGALAVILCAIWYYRIEALNRGLNLFGFTIRDRIDVLLTALILCSGVMVITELIRLWWRSGGQFLHWDPDLRKGNYFRFLVTSLFNYLLYLGLLALAIIFFHSANEYGFAKNAAYYQSWFRFLDLTWTAWLWAGLPYTLITRALKHDADADRRDLTTSFQKLILYFVARLPPFRAFSPRFDEFDKKAVRGLLVKLFFAPLMTVFFCDQFPNLIRNAGFLLDQLSVAIATGAYTHRRLNNDLFNISIAIIFSIDVALAWCGYIVSSRWVDNQTLSAEPTMLGWVVCITCYPPFQMFLGLYFSAPGERGILGFANLWLVTIFTSMMVLSYLIYMSATLWFGVRFSNLTNRGIIRKGPFRFVRHPAYASKNFAWWCVMFPAVVFNIENTGWGVALFQFVGLLFMTGFYYMRALTEERHLLADPAYQAYCQQVRYRFIPGVI